MKEWQVIKVTDHLAQLDPVVLAVEAYRRGYIGREFSLVTMEWDGVTCALGRGMTDLGPSDVVPDGLEVIAEFDTLEDYHAARAIHVPPTEEAI